MKKLVFITIVTYNNNNVILKCLQSLNEQTYQNFELLIIDNNSTDNTLTIINNYLHNNENLAKKTHILKNKINKGFAKAVNIGLKRTLIIEDAYAALLLNPDVYFTKDLLQNGVKVLEENIQAGAVLPKILYSDNRIWWIGTRIFTDKELLFSSNYGISTHIHKGERWKSHNNIQAVDAVTGCALFLRVNAIKKVGLFDERYFMYGEDIDYSNRLKQQGYTLLMFPQSTVFHEVRDKKMNIHIVLSSLRKYKIYLTSVGLYLLQYKPFYFFFIWLGKLPYALTKNYFMKSKKVQ